MRLNDFATVAQLAEQRFCNRSDVASTGPETAVFSSIFPRIFPLGSPKNRFQGSSALDYRTLTVACNPVLGDTRDPLHRRTGAAGLLTELTL